MAGYRPELYERGARANRIATGRRKVLSPAGPTYEISEDDSTSLFTAVGGVTNYVLPPAVPGLEFLFWGALTITAGSDDAIIFTDTPTPAGGNISTGSPRSVWLVAVEGNKWIGFCSQDNTQWAISS